MAEPYATVHAQRFGRKIERQDGKDFPYYSGEPVALTPLQWFLLAVSPALGFAALVLIPASNNVGELVPRILFTGIPLAALIYVAKDKWKALFSKPKLADYKVMVGFFLLNIAVTVVIAGLVKALFGANANPATDTLTNASAVEYVAFYVGTGIQLMGEELLTILPFLAIMYVLYSRKKFSRKTAIVSAWVGTAVLFGAIHLPTYDWNFAQAIVVIGCARIILTLAFIRTKNLLVSYGAHVLNDWAIFTFTVLFA